MVLSQASRCLQQTVMCCHVGAGNEVLASFLELVFRRLLLEDLGNDTVELAADALLPLILAHTDAYQSLGEAPLLPLIPLGSIGMSVPLYHHGSQGCTSACRSMRG